MHNHHNFFKLSKIVCVFHQVKMETMKVEKLSRYFHQCLESGSNICVLENSNIPTPSSASTSTNGSSHSTNSASTKNEKLCGHHQNENYIYAVKFGNHSWHYFDDIDSLGAHHVSLHCSVNDLIRGLRGVGTITVELDDAQSECYFQNGKFMFGNKELKTYASIAAGSQHVKSKVTDKSTKQLVFVSGKTNPLLFLNEFEKCKDIKSDKDKMYKILDFVDERHKGEFTKLYFTGDWASVRTYFLKSYSLTFTRNKKKSLDIDFAETTSLRSFFEMKLSSLSKFTTLPFLNQIEIVINDLPPEISSLFIVNEKMTGNKTEILDFCDSIRDLVNANNDNSNDITIQDSGTFRLIIV